MNIDIAFSCDDTRENPNSMLEIIPGMEAFNIEAPEKTNKIIWNFLRKIIKF
ncbi:MAG: hypothetical protein ACFFFB_05025 [Candidatus Heimdallarchaeota archaeon]